MEDCLKSPNKQLSGIRKLFGQHGDFVIHAFLNVVIADLVSFFNLGKNMNDQQIKQTSQLIISEYWFLKPEDFKLCFNQAKKGRYGKVFDRIDGMVIMEWLNQYCLERTEVADEMNFQKHDQIKYQTEIENRDRDAAAAEKISNYTEELRKHMVSNLNQQENG